MCYKGITSSEPFMRVPLENPPCCGSELTSPVQYSLRIIVTPLFVWPVRLVKNPVGNPSRDELTLIGLSVITWFHDHGDPVRGFPIDSRVHHLENSSLDIGRNLVIYFTNIRGQAMLYAS